MDESEAVNKWFGHAHHPELAEGLISPDLIGREYYGPWSVVVYLINKTEYWLHMSHNMAFMAYSMLDLMCCPKSNLKKLGVFREVTWELHKMGRISNWITTQQREIESNDFTSGIFAYAIEKNILTFDELITASKRQIINKIKRENVENDLLEEWEKSYNRIKQAKHNIGAATIKSYFDGQRLFLYTNLVSRGSK